jgi:HEAT repeat protein
MQALLEKAQIALNKKDWETVNASIQRLLNQKDAIEPIINDEILDLALEALQKCDFPQRWEIAKLFPQIGQSAIAPLIALLESEEQDGEMRWFLARISVNLTIEPVFSLSVNYCKDRRRRNSAKWLRLL